MCDWRFVHSHITLPDAIGPDLKKWYKGLIFLMKSQTDWHVDLACGKTLVQAC